MCQIRYSVAPSPNGWVVRRDCQRVGAFEDGPRAELAALELAAIDRVRGHAVEILKLDDGGRWQLLGLGNRHLCDTQP